MKMTIYRIKFTRVNVNETVLAVNFTTFSKLRFRLAEILISLLDRVIGTPSRAHNQELAAGDDNPTFSDNGSVSDVVPVSAG